MFPLFSTDCHSEPHRLNVCLNGMQVHMDLDTGAALTVINQATYEQLLEQAQQDSPGTSLLQPSIKLLRSYTGHSIPVLGTMEVEARYGGRLLVLPLHVLAGGGPNLMGRYWLSHFDVDMTTLNLIDPDGKLEAMLWRYTAVFSEELGCVEGPPVKLLVPEGTEPKFYKPRPVPYSLRGKVEAELANLQGEGIISPVQTFSWATPVVPVLKRDSRVRLCGDFKLTTALCGGAIC